MSPLRAGPPSHLDAMPERLSGSLRERWRRAEADPSWGTACADAAWEWARDADRHFRAVAEMHPTRRPLLRVGVKDNIDCRELATRLGSRNVRRHPREDAAVLAGVPPANVTCKTQLTELTLGRGAGCRNPLFPGGWPGASSTGSAVAVAANICDVAAATDSVGSIRIPAAACGVVGLRLTHAASLLRGILPVSPSLDAPGWFARTPDDLRFAMERFGLLPSASSCTPGALRLGIVSEVLSDSCDAAVRRAYEALADRAETAGVQTVWIDLGDVWDARVSAWQLCAREAFESLAPHGEALGPFGSDVASVLKLGERVAPAVAKQARARQRPLARTLRRRLDDLAVDAFVLPVYPFAFPSQEDIDHWPMIFPDTEDPAAAAMAGYTPIASLLGWPALSIPTGHGRADRYRQAGVQLIGRPHSEGLLLDVATALLASPGARCSSASPPVTAGERRTDSGRGEHRERARAGR
jgi:Asp-tRNA(Asn)/Glu-tRNA(Gln) amidotransferase A subunit family amidase